MRAFLLPLLATLALAAPSALRAQQPAAPRGQGTLLVTVTDDSTGLPLRGARVRVAGVTGVATTGDDGVARLPGVPAGTQRVEVVQPGYRMSRVQVAVEPGPPRPVGVRMVPQIEEVTLPGLRVTSWGRSTALRNRGFYDRQRANFGTFLTEDEIAARLPLHGTDVLRGVRGFTVTRVRTVDDGSFDVPTTTHSPGLSLCIPRVFIDNVPASGNPTFLYDLNPNDIEGIEAYPSPSSVPAEYGGSFARCGVVLVWTKTGPKS